MLRIIASFAHLVYLGDHVPAYANRGDSLGLYGGGVSRDLAVAARWPRWNGEGPLYTVSPDPVGPIMRVLW